MPSTMVHLMSAYYFKPGSPEEFWVGNIAPDCIDDWKEKDRLHFRDTENREQALIGFAKTIEENDLFSEGMLLHLFVDWKWDESLRRQYINKSSSDGWFQSYRNEIGLLSARLYHDNAWSAKVWEGMLNCNISAFNKTKEISTENILSSLQRANKYHVENVSAHPLFYSVKSVEEFAAKTAEDYRCWMNIVK